VTGTYDIENVDTPHALAVDEMLLRCVPDLPKDSVTLDLGCGSGRHVTRLAKLGSRVVGADLVHEMIGLAVQKLSPRTRALSDFVVADAETLPFRRLSFDLCMSIGTLHHLPHPEEALQEVARTLNCDTTLLICDPNSGALRRIYDRLSFLHAWRTIKSHHLRFSRGQMLDLLVGAGLSVRRISTHTYVPPKLLEPFRRCQSVASSILEFSDFLASKIPIIKDFGGLILAIASKGSISAGGLRTRRGTQIETASGCHPSMSLVRQEGTVGDQ